MAELINKWAVVDKLTALENEFQHYKPFEGFEHAMYRKVCEAEMEIGKMTGVEVVLCKKCRYYNPDGEYCGFWGGVRHPEHYCGEGDRESNE